MPNKNFSIAVVIKAIDRATSVMNGVSEKFGRAGKRIGNIGKGISTNIGLPMAALGGVSWNAALSFDESMTKIMTQAGATRADMGMLSREALRMGPELGVMPAELAAAMLEAQSAGASLGETLEMTEQAGMASAIGLSSAVDMVSTLTSVTRVYRGEGLKAGAATDILFRAIRLGKGNASELAPELGGLAILGKQINVSFADMAASMAAFTLNGISATEASTQLRGIFISLLRPSKQSRDALRALGYDTAKVAREIKETNLQTVLQRLEATARKKGKIRLFQDLFPDQQAYLGALGLVDDKLGETAAVIDRVKNGTESLADAYLDASGQPSQQMKKAAASVNADFIRLGMAIAPALGPIVDMVRKVSKAFAGLSPRTQKFIVAGIALSVVLGPLVMGFASLVTMVAVVAPLLAAVSLPVWGIIAAVVAAIAVLAWFIADFKGAAKTLIKWSPFGILVQAINEVSKALFGVDLIAAGKKWMSDFWDGLKAIWPKLSAWFMDAVRVMLAAVPQILLPDSLKLASFGKERAQLDADEASRNSAIAAAGQSIPRAGLSLRDQMRASVGRMRDSAALVPMRADEAKAEVTVSFKDMPKGAQAYFGKKDPGVKLNLDTGYAMGY